MNDLLMLYIAVCMVGIILWGLLVAPLGIFVWIGGSMLFLFLFSGQCNVEGLKSIFADDDGKITFWNATLPFFVWGGLYLAVHLVYFAFTGHFFYRG